MTLNEGEERKERGRLQGLGPSQAFDITSFACVGLSRVDRQTHTVQPWEAWYNVAAKTHKNATGGFQAPMGWHFEILKHSRLIKVMCP